MPRKATALLVALSVVLLVPACGVFASQTRGAPATAVSGPLWSAAGHTQHHGDAASADRCASLGQGATASAADGRLAPERGAEPALVPAVRWNSVAKLFLAQSAAAPYPPPPAAAFYLRSARILR
jgi:hypothetical protein